MTIRSVLGRFKRHQPDTLEQTLTLCKVPLQYIGSGVFRNVFEVIGLPLVIKCPETEALEHSAVEMNYIGRIMAERELASLRKYMPKVYYYNTKTGLMLMHKYDTPKETKRFKDDCEQLTEKINHVFEWVAADVDCHPGNCGYDSKGQLKIFDLGLFEGCYGSS